MEGRYKYTLSDQNVGLSLSEVMLKQQAGKVRRNGAIQSVIHNKDGILKNAIAILEMLQKECSNDE